jgi:DNA invertase Pin-like site-specific DNA recombinase
VVGPGQRNRRVGTSENAEVVRAAQYVRMSTEHQQYSTENQAEAIRHYAERRGFEIVRTYADEGRSGLRLAGRDALTRLIADVEGGNADFSAILVYDVSRWGRFQDADESAYYEQICKRANIGVHYCAEQFENDGSPVSTIIKGVKRAMAGEYSRELSVKVFAGQSRLIEHGFRQGGAAGFGLRRQLIDQAKVAKGQLSRGEHKSIQTDRVVLVPGPMNEVETVRWMYRMFVEGGKSEQEIAGALNERGISTDLGRPWTRGTVHQVLINEKYVGHNVWNRISFKLKQRRIRNEPNMWIRADGAFPAIVEQAVFDAAQVIIQARTLRLTDTEMLAALSASSSAKASFPESSLTRPKDCHRAAPTGPALAACCAPTTWSASALAGTTVTSRSIECCGSCIRAL